MPRSFPSRSFSSSSLSSSSSSSSSTQPSRSISRTPSTHRLKRWLSSHLLPRQDHPAYHHHHHHNHHDQNHSQNNSHSNVVTKSPNTDIISQSQPSSTTQVPAEQALSQPRFAGFDYNYEYDHESDFQYHAGNQQDEVDADREEDIVLSDNYAAYCRAFTSSPTLCRDSPLALPLPRFPPSDSWEEHQGPAGPDANHASVEDVSRMHFLPVGAHGYHPAPWVLPRPLSPPPGILTPARYEEIQQRRARERLEKDKEKRRRGKVMWCIPIRASWWPWARAREF
ncbi:hypothetical protein BDW62DRAFT_171953 [Aspergillus aurantiobrunneus]